MPPADRAPESAYGAKPLGNCRRLKERFFKTIAIARVKAVVLISRTAKKKRRNGLPKQGRHQSKIVRLAYVISSRFLCRSLPNARYSTPRHPQSVFVRLFVRQHRQHHHAHGRGIIAQLQVQQCSIRTGHTERRVYKACRHGNCMTELGIGGHRIDKK
jgi:hypothetical protein